MSEGTPIIIKKKKGHGEHAHHGGSWKVAYADFVTAMMAFFMVMWIMGLSQDTRTIIAGYFNDPSGFMKNTPRSKTVISLKGMLAPTPGKNHKDGTEPLKDELNERKLQKKIENAVKGTPDLKFLLENKSLEMMVTQDGLRIEFVEAAGSVFFESGRDVIRPEAMKLISKIGPILAQSGRKMRVEGHTDSVPYPSQTYDNWDLSTDRALALKRALRQSGVSLAQIDEVKGYADTKLKDGAHPTSSINRRVTLLLPFANFVSQSKYVELEKPSIHQNSEAVFTDSRKMIRPQTIDIKGEGR